MHCTPAELQLIHLIRAAADRDLTLILRTRAGRYRVSVHDPAVGSGSGEGPDFDTAWWDVRADPRLRKGAA